jgi:PKD repeat protein
MRLSDQWLFRRLGGRARRTRGQSLVEFALVLPVLMLLLLITIDFGRLFLSYVSLNNTARVAANYGSLNVGPYTSGSTVLTTYNTTVTAEGGTFADTCPIDNAAGNPDPNNPPVPTYPDGNGLGAISQATMTCRFSFLTPFISAFFGGSLPMSATAQFPIRTGALASIGAGTGVPVIVPPVANFSFIDVSGGTVDGSGNVDGSSLSVKVNFQDGSTSAQTWDWSFGDGTADYTADAPPAVPPAHTYTLPVDATAPFVYYVRLTVTNPAGTSSVIREVTLNPAAANPVAAFYGVPVGSPPQASGGGAPPTGTDIEGSRPLTVTYYNTSVGATAYSWDFGDGQTSTSTAPSHQYTALGVYSVTLSITSPAGANPFTRSNYVTVGCVVPNFANSGTDSAQSTWASAGFSGTITYLKQANGSTSTSPPSANKTIISQTNTNTTPLFNATGGAFDDPTISGSVWQCAGDITLTYGP